MASLIYTCVVEVRLEVQFQQSRTWPTGPLVSKLAIATMGVLGSVTTKVLLLVTESVSV